MVVGVENPRTLTSKPIDGGLEENTLAILDSSGVRDSRDILDDKLSFLEAVRAASLASDSPTAPSWKMYDAVFEILRGSGSLELAMASFELLTDLDMRFPRTCLRSPDSPESEPRSSSAGTGWLAVVKEAWSPFSVGSDGGHSDGEANSRNSFLFDSLRFSTLIDEICQAVNRRESQLTIKPAGNMLLFQYLVGVIERDFLPRQTFYKETLDWVLLREALLSMLLASRRVNFKNMVRDCMSILVQRCHQHTDVNLKDLKERATVSGYAKIYQDCDLALEYAASQLQRQTCISVQKILTLTMELDVNKKEADINGLTSRADGLRAPVLDIILDELTYAKDSLSAFLEIFSHPRWKMEMILQYFSKYFPKSSVRTRRSNEIPKDATFEDVLIYFASAASTKGFVRKVAPQDALCLLAHAFQAYLSLNHDQQHVANKSEKVRGNLSQICNSLMSAFQNIRKVDKNIELSQFEKEAFFMAVSIASYKP